MSETSGKSEYAVSRVRGNFIKVKKKRKQGSVVNGRITEKDIEPFLSVTG